VPKSCEFNGGLSANDGHPSKIRSCLILTGESLHANIHHCDGDDGCCCPILIAGVDASARRRFRPGFVRHMEPHNPGLRTAAIGAWPGEEPARRTGPQAGVGDGRQLVGDYTNPILQPWAAEVLKKFGEISLAGKGYPIPRDQCWPEGVPSVFANFGMQMLQRPDRITILYPFDHQFRQVRMNQSHPAQVTPSWYGDSVGHYEDDELVIDTAGVKIGPFSMIDWYGTPYTEALHLEERYRLLDYEATQRDAKENFQIYNPDDGPAIDPNYKGKGLQLQFTVEDEGVFTTPWSATVTYRRAFDERLELVCAENLPWYPGKRSAVPRADKPDF
jgi:hypothetical protein